MLKIYNKAQIDIVLKKLGERADSVPSEVMTSVSEVISCIRSGGDRILREYTEKFDKVKIEDFYLSDSEKKRLIEKVPSELRTAMERSAENIFSFHEKQKTQSWVDAKPGKIMGQRVLPLRRVGMYVPGGTAAYPSSVLMNAIPATVAGVKELVMVTPPKAEGLNPAVVCAADIAGVRQVLTIGGAQAIAALAYGTESIPRVDKIVGPGNIYVATAKRLVYGAVDIDMIAGPSEVLVIADDESNPRYVAADLMSQAEHDPMAASILIARSASFIEKVTAELERQIKTLSRSDIIAASFKNNGCAVVVDSIEEAATLANTIAPEHLELAVKSPFDYLGLIENAGSVFMGENAPEPLGDYYAGPNHVLPTNGTARFSSALSVDAFVKRSSYLYYDAAELKKASDDVIRFAQAEGLTAHANSIIIRRENTER